MHVYGEMSLKGSDVPDAQAIPTKVIGSSVVLLGRVAGDTQFLNQANLTRIFSSTGITNNPSSKPFDVSKLKNKFVKVTNNYNVALTNVVVEFTRTINTGDTEVWHSVTVASGLAAGASVLISPTVTEYVNMQLPAIGMRVRLFATTAPTTGSLDIEAWGGVN